jgi:hypothetical protein
VSPPAKQISRRGLFAALKPRNLGLALAEGLAWTDLSREVTAPEAAPDLPEWRDGLDRVLEQMNDLSGIEEP